VIDKLPDRNVLLMRRLFDVLSKVAANAQKNKMSADNLAVVFGPCLIFSLETKEALALFSDSSTVTSLVSKLIQNQSSLKLDRKLDTTDPKKKKKTSTKTRKRTKKESKTREKR